MLVDSDLIGCNQVRFSMKQPHKLSNNFGELCADSKPYRRLIGCLLYLIITRVEICYVVHLLNQLMHSPRQHHIEVAYRVLRYIKGTPRQGILLSSHGSLTLQTYCDADWA